MSEEKEKTEGLVIDTSEESEPVKEASAADASKSETKAENTLDSNAEEKDRADKSSEKLEDADSDDVAVGSYGAVTSIFEWVQPLLVALVVVTMLFTFVFRQVTVSGGSMENTLRDKDRLIVTNFFYEPEVGDIVVISHGQKYDSPLIKRVIATEGQSLSIDFETGDVVVDGVLLDEPYTYGETIRAAQNPMEVPEVIPEGYVYVMGDHRNSSLDSRSATVGLIKKEDIIGKAEFRIFPLSTFGSIY